MALLTGKVAIVSGGSGGIGSAISELFAAEGASVVIHYGKSKELAEKLAKELSKKYKTNCIALGANAPDKIAVDTLVRKTIKEFGKVDILANFLGFPVNKETAGHFWQELFEKSEWEHFEAVFNVDVRGTVNFCQAVIPYMKKQKYGRIINVSSSPAIAGHTRGHAFTAAKAAVMGLTKDLALELGQYKITANAIAPGNIETGWSKTLTKKEYDMIKNESPMKRWGQPKDIANVALFLASDLSGFVNGQAIIVDGGTVMR